MRAALFSIAILLFSMAARANDSAAEISLGGLSFTKSDAISMDSEDLFISRDAVRVKYRFTNTSDAPIDTLVAFPLPDIPPALEDDMRYWANPSADLKFKTKVDGQPFNLTLVEQAIFKGQDIGARLTALKIPLNRFAENFDTAVNRLPKAERGKLVADALIREDGMTTEPIWAALWTLRTALTRRQVFPPNASVTVEHEYAPLAGGAVGGYLDPQYRRGEDGKWFDEKRRKFCIDDDWVRSFDKKLRAPGRAPSAYSETWLGYVLNTGANWKGPIGDFRLIVDKGKPESLVSFCAQGLKKISPTQFELRRKDFTPDRDLDILIVDWTE